MLTPRASPSRSACALRAQAPWRAAACGHEEARTLLPGRQADPSRWDQPLPPGGLAAPARRDRRPHPARVLRDPSERAQGRLRRLPAPRLCLVRRAGNRGRARALGQREGLPLASLARHLHRASDRPALYAPLLAVDEREGGSADQDAPARVGLSLRLPHQRSPRSSPAWLPAVVQPTTTARLARSPTAGQPRLTRVWSVHLALEPSLDPGGGLPRSSETHSCDLKRHGRSADTGNVDAAERKEILNRYRDHSRRFEAAAARRSSTRRGAVIPFTPPSTREVGQDPTAREIEVLQLVADGLVNREIGERLFLSEETVKSHVRHLLAKLQARSRAHAVAVGFRRGIIG